MRAVGTSVADGRFNLFADFYNNHRIQVFTAEGKFLRMFGGGGWSRRKLDGPTGVATDSSYRVYIREWNIGHVSVFTSEGHVTSFGSGGSPRNHRTQSQGHTR